MGTMSALNRAFEKAFAHTATKETLMDLLACLGEELSCDRISIFECNIDNTWDNTYEWCRDTVVREREMLQGIPIWKLDSWKDRLMADEVLHIRDLSQIKETDPDIYELFHAQDVHCVIVSKLAFHGKGMGFFVLENPYEGMMTETEVILPGLRYILSSLVYSDQLVRRLEQIGYVDKLTGAGNRLSLQEHLECLEIEKSLGLIYCEVLGWVTHDERPEHLRDEQKLLRMGELLCNIFGKDSVFRVGQDEFLVLVEGEGEGVFFESVRLMSHMIEENDLLAATGKLWRENASEGYETLIRQIRFLVYQEKRTILEHRAVMPHSRERQVHTDFRTGSGDLKEKVNIQLPRGEAFFQRAEEFLSEIYDQPVMTVVIDINYFKLYNDIFGRKAGNILLEEIADSLGEEADSQKGVAGYLGGDNFCLMVPVKLTSQNELAPVIESLFEDLRYPEGFTPALGIYLSTNRQERMITMYDRALSALSEIKGSYMEHYRFYDAGHFQHMREDKLLLMDIKKSLANGDFLFYLQPQVHERTGKIVGAEALVRWNRNGELIVPGRFIPLLEKTGYIFAVDCYVWEHVVKWIRKMLDEGIKVPYCSVNVSRVDFYFTDIAAHFIDLVKRYGVSSSQISVEITESAFTDNTDTILDSVQRLHEAGFRVMMDDFGSGSSSLSMLHTMHLDVLKTDVRFMSKKSADRRAVSIVESVVTMAHMIGMLVVTEGVETEEQRDNLIALGDNYAQGYFFYKPMPPQEFEKLIRTPGKVGETPYQGKNVPKNHLGFRSMIQEGMVSDTLLDNIIGPAAVYKDEGGRFTLVQMNEQYTKLTGIEPDQQDRMDHFIEKYISREVGEFSAIVHGADTHPLEGSSGCLFLHREDGESIPVEARIFLLYSGTEYKLYLSTLQERM